MADLILAIETSCDETAAAVFSSTKGLLSNELFSQTMLHRKFGGVVPEIASRSHLEKIPIIVEQALKNAAVSLSDIGAIAVTTNPGLPGSLLIGLCFAKGIALAKQVPLIGVNHLEGHIFSPFLENDVPLPHLCLTASGGHTALYLVHGFGRYTLLGQTVDDAAGEAFDKVAKLIGLGYPGGPVIERYAKAVDFEDFYHYPRNKGATLNLSFSGLKTAVFYDLVKKRACDFKTKTFDSKKSDAVTIQHRVASSFLVCVADIFKQKLERAFKHHPTIKAVTFAGGVACNAYIRHELETLCKNHEKSFFFPAAKFSTDNAAMIAFVGNYKMKQKEFSDLSLDILK